MIEENDRDYADLLRTGLGELAIEIKLYRARWEVAMEARLQERLVSRDEVLSSRPRSEIPYPGRASQPEYLQLRRKREARRSLRRARGQISRGTTISLGRACPLRSATTQVKVVGTLDGLLQEANKRRFDGKIGESLRDARRAGTTAAQVELTYPNA